MIEHIILNNLEVFIAVGDASFYGQQMNPVSAEVEFTHDMRIPHKVRVPDGVVLRCAMPHGDPLIIQLPANFDVTDSIDKGQIMRAVLLARLEKEANEIDAGLARRPSLEKIHG